MQLIKPRQISGEIMTLIEEADEKIILVSPYFKVSNWQKILNSFDDVKKRQIDIEIYIRKDQYDSVKEVQNIGFEPITRANLHTKLYLNEKIGIVSSMNLLQSSDNNSLDIALKTENPKEYDDLWEYYLRYIKQPKSFDQEDSAHWIDRLATALNSALARKVYIRQETDYIQINVNNRYEASIENDPISHFTIDGILSSKEYDYLVQHPESLNLSRLKLSHDPGGNGYYSTVSGTIENIKSKHILNLNKKDGM